MGIKRCHIVVLVLMGLSSLLHSQKSIKNDADKFFEKGKYFEALKLYNIYDKVSTNKEALKRRAISNYHCHKLDACSLDLDRLSFLNVKDRELDYYRALLLYDLHDFKNAAIALKGLLKKEENKSRRQDIIQKIKNCGYGLDHAYDEQIAFVENLGDVVNSRYDELNAIQSPNFDDKFYFSSNREGSMGGMRDERGLKDDLYGNYALDILACQSYNGIWEQPSALDPLLNSPKNDLLMDFNSDGSVMLFKKTLSDLSTGSILVDTFKVDRDPSEFSKPYISPVVGELGDGYIKMFNDSTLIFSSKRKGGFGGYDLYVVGYRDGEWTVPFNLGPNVNSSADEVSPFVSNDGRTLFFSSNRNEGYGGFDVYTTLLSGERPTWEPVQNIGRPINSSADDVYYKLSNNGMTATFSSNRKSGFGGYDLYIAYLTAQNMSQLAYSPRFMFFEERLEKYYETILANPEVTQEEAIEEVAVLDETKTENEEEELSKRDVIIGPLFYGDDDNVLTTQNQIKIKALKDLMVIYPDLKIRLISHSISEGLANYDLYFSIKRVEKVREELVSSGIDERRIQLIACGPNYPLVKNELAGKKINLADKLNRRIDIKLLNAEELNIEVTEEEPVVADYLRDSKSDLFYTQLEGLSYRVEVARVRQMFQNSIVANTNDVIIEEEDGDYVYTVGMLSDFESVKRTKNLLGKKRLLDTQISAYIDGIRLEENELPGKLEDYPDLAKFIEFLNQ